MSALNNCIIVIILTIWKKKDTHIEKIHGEGKKRTVNVHNEPCKIRWKTTMNMNHN